MKSEVKKISQTVSELHVTVDAKTVSQDYNEILKKYRKLTVVKGFRKGKAPLSLVERYYGDYIKQEFNEEIGEKYYSEAIDDADIQPIAPGALKDVKWEKGEDLQAVYVVETNPEFDLKEYMGVEIPHEAKELKDNDLEMKMQELRKSAATEVETEEPIKSGFKVEGTLQVMDENQERVIQEKDESFEVGNNEYSEEFNNEFIGKLAGDEVVAPLFKKSDNEEDKKYVGKMIIDSVSIVTLPDLDDDFAKDMEYESLEDMKNQVKSDLQKEIDKDNKARLKADIMNYLVNENDFEVPSSFIQNYINQMVQPYKEQMNDEQLKQLYPMFAENATGEIKKYYISKKLRDDLNPEISEEYRDAFIKELADNMNMDVEKYKKMYQERIENDEFEEYIKDAKIIEMIAEKAKFIEYPKPEENDNPSEEVEEKEEVNESNEEK